FKTSQWTIYHCLFETFFNCRNKFLGNVTTFYFVYELKADFSFFGRLQSKYDIGKFTTTTGLLFVNFPVVCSSCERFFVFNLWLTLVNLYLEFATQTVNNNIQVKLTHP